MPPLTLQEEGLTMGTSCPSPRRGQVCACAVLFGAPWLCLLSVCCCLSCCACAVASCQRRFSSLYLWCLIGVLYPLVLFCGACGLSLPLGAVVGLPCCAATCCAVSTCIGVCCIDFLGVVFCPVVGCRVVLPHPFAPPGVVRYFLFFRVGCVLVVPPPPPPAGCGAMSCAVSCVLLCSAAVCGVACFAFYLVLYVVPVLGRVRAPCCEAQWCAGSCCAVFVVLDCRVLLSSPLFFFGVVPCLSVVLLAVSVCVSAVVRLAVRRGPVATCSCAGFCCAVPFGALVCCGVSLDSVLCCLSVCCYGGLSCSVLRRGAVLSGCAACGPGAVVPCAVFLGASRFMAPLVRCCAGVPVLLLSVWRSLAPLALAGAVCCCLLFLGACC